MKKKKNTHTVIMLKLEQGDSNIITTSLYNSLIKKYQETLENKMEGSSFVFHYVNFLDIKFNQTEVHTLKLLNGYLIRKPLLILKMMITIVLCMS